MQHYAHITYNYLSTCTVIFSSNPFLPKRGLNVFPLVDHQLPSSQTQITRWTVHRPAPPSPTGFISNHLSQLPTVQYQKVAADPKSWKAPGLTRQFIQTLTTLMSQTGKICTRIVFSLIRGAFWLSVACSTRSVSKTKLDIKRCNFYKEVQTSRLFTPPLVSHRWLFRSV